VRASVVIYARRWNMKGFIGKGELNKDMYISGRVAALLREINNATLKGGADNNHLLERNWT
jgi:hypothetical protein